MIEPSYIQMHIAQVLPVIDAAKKKEYDTEKITEHISTLEDIMNVLQTFDMTKKTEGELEEILLILNYVSDCIGYIVYSTVDDVPLEIYMALRSVMKEWIRDAENYVFVAHDNPYCITTYYWSFNCKSIIKNVTGIDIKYNLVFFSVPTHLKNDFLCNTALYHEFGHFIDKYYKISPTLSYNLYIGNLKCSDTSYINNASNKEQIESYLGEYFADLFAAQYLGVAAYSYLNYINENGGFGKEHPSTKKRKEVVNDFLAGKNNDVLQLITAVTKYFNLDLKPRNKSIDLSCFFADQPYAINDASDFHAILSSGVGLWVNERHNFTYPDGRQMHYLDAYNKMNSLIQLSAEDYLNNNP